MAARTFDTCIESHAHMLRSTCDLLCAFGRAEHMTGVIFEGKKDIEGKIVPVLIQSSNQNNLFGKLKINKSVIAA